MGLYNLEVLPKMDIKEAKGIVGSYLEHNVIQDVKT